MAAVACPSKYPVRSGGASRLRWLLCLGAVIVMAIAGCLPGQSRREAVQTGQHPYTFEQGDLHINYLLYVPAAYGKIPWKRWPLLIFLHGSGEAGRSLEDLERVALNGPPHELARSQPLPELANNFIVLSPQTPDALSWERVFPALDGLLTELESTYAVDLKRVYLTGLSLGGFGTWQYATRHPESFAALVPIAGGYDYEVDTMYLGSGSGGRMLRFTRIIPNTVCTLKEIPVWVFHGALDDTVPYKETAEPVVEAFRACGGTITFTLYPDAGHDSWTETYANPELYTWLLAQRKD